MKIGVLSDVHSNLEALQACCAYAEQQGVAAYVGLGDFVNYGPDPVATLDALMALPHLIAVLGNHDEAMFREPMWSSSSELGHATAWTRARLTREHLAFLRDLPYIQCAHGAVFAHAAFDFPGNWEYVVKPKQAKKCFKATHGRRLFLGHVHKPGVFCEAPDGSIEELQPQAGHAYRLALDRRYLINAGSVGQPRDGHNTACFVIYDEAAQAISFHRVAYDFAETARKIRAARLHPFYADRLAVGQ